MFEVHMFFFMNAPKIWLCCNVHIRSQNWVGDMRVTCLVGQNITCFTCVQILGHHISSLLFLFIQILPDPSMMACWKQSFGSLGHVNFSSFSLLFSILQGREGAPKKTVGYHLLWFMYISLGDQSLSCTSVLRWYWRMLLWKQLLAKLTQYRRDYLNSSSPHPSLHPNKNQKLTKFIVFFTKTNDTDWPFTPGVRPWFSGSSRLIGSCCLSSFQREGMWREWKSYDLPNDFKKSCSNGQRFRKLSIAKSGNCWPATGQH